MSEETKTENTNPLESIQNADLVEVGNFLHEFGWLLPIMVGVDLAIAKEKARAEERGDENAALFFKRMVDKDPTMIEVIGRIIEAAMSAAGKKFPG